MSKDIETFVKQCLLCTMLRTGPKPLPGTQQTLSKPHAFSMLSLDTVGPISSRLLELSFYIQVAIDHYSRYMVTALHAQSPTSAMVVEFVRDKWVAYFGTPVAILTDRGSPYVSAPFRPWVTQYLGAKSDSYLTVLPPRECYQ